MKVVAYIENEKEKKIIDEFLSKYNSEILFCFNPETTVKTLASHPDTRVLIFTDYFKNGNEDFGWFVENARRIHESGDVLFIYRKHSNITFVNHKFRRPNVINVSRNDLSVEFLSNLFG